jgi:hypothetical protein
VTTVTRPEILYRKREIKEKSKNMNDELFDKLWKQFVEDYNKNPDKYDYPKYECCYTGYYEDQMNEEMLSNH